MGRMNEKEVMAKIEAMSIEEKLKLLSETDKAYIRGFIERAVLEQQRNDTVSSARTPKNRNA